MTASAQRIGDILVAQGALERPVLEHFAAIARGPLGRFLFLNGAIPGRALTQAMAQQLGTPSVDLTRDTPDRCLFRPGDFDHYLHRQYLPFRRRGEVLILATSEPSAELRRWAEQHYQCSVELWATSRRDMSHAFSTLGAQASTRRARLNLRRRQKTLIADRVLMPHQLHGLAIIMVALATALFAAPLTTWYTLLLACNLFYAATLAVKWHLYTQGTTARRELRKLEKTLAESASLLTDDELPTYSILVPLYHESKKVMGRLLANLSALAYPRDKLDIKLIVEADDEKTIAALKALHPPEFMEIVSVVPSKPRTKPKACNVALQRIRGEYLVIYDAEDAPAIDQLKRAVALFRQSPENVACLQAPLNYYNRDENLLTQLFAIEYSALFRLLLPALERMRLPIPLGGTSNHLRTDALRAVGGWDAFNVTEDADLGIRLAWLGYETRMLPSLTLEESPVTLRAWMKQRTRWIKGYIQTWLVYTRDPAELKRRLGREGYYGFQFFVGAPALTFLLAPLFWAIFLASFLGFMPFHLSPTMLSLCLIVFFGGIASHWFFARAVISWERWYELRLAGILYPLYWLLHSFAAARALVQLARRPHLWEKTRHGVSKCFKTAEIGS